MPEPGFTLVLTTTRPAGRGLPASPVGIFHYDFATREEALAVLEAELWPQEAKRRPRKISLGRDRWRLDHPRQPSIYPLTVEIQKART